MSVPVKFDYDGKNLNIPSLHRDNVPDMVSGLFTEKNQVTFTNFIVHIMRTLTIIFSLLTTCSACNHKNSVNALESSPKFVNYDTFGGGKHHLMI